VLRFVAVVASFGPIICIKVEWKIKLTVASCISHSNYTDFDHNYCNHFVNRSYNLIGRDLVKKMIKNFEMYLTLTVVVVSSIFNHYLIFID